MEHTARLAALMVAFSPLAARAQTPVAPTGPVVHREARIDFPERFGDFVRTSVLNYDGYGRDLGVTYRKLVAGEEVTVTINVAPGPPAGTRAAQRRACQRVFDRDMVETRSVSGWQRLRIGPDETGPRRPGGAAALSHRVMLRYSLPTGAGVSRPVTADYDLFCFVGGRWMVKYQAVGPEGYPIAAAVRRFIATGPWPGRAGGPRRHAG